MSKIAYFRSGVQVESPKCLSDTDTLNNLNKKQVAARFVEGGRNAWKESGGQVK
jgi:hypothetical protein